jgi:hypothetical protein
MSQTFLAELAFSFLNARDVALWHEAHVPKANPDALLPKVMRTAPSPGHSGSMSTRPNDLDGESYIRSDITAIYG